MTELAVRTEPLGGSPLVRAALAGALPEAWYPPRPRDASAWRRHAHQVAGHADDRWLRRLAPAISPSGAAADRLRRAATHGGVVVTTGQQPGLFGGPIYTWSKALSALALADRLEAATGIATAPVFWAATDDADFAEAAATWVALPGGARRLALPPTAEPGRALAAVPLGDVREQLAELERAAGSAAYRVPLDVAARAYAPDATVGGAYLALLRALLGIAVLDAAHPAVRTAGDHLLRQALRRAPALERAVAARVAELETAGFESQVSPVPGLSLVFERADADKARVPLDRAEAVADDASAMLGSTVLLRPVLERYLLPTAAYVAGPGELAYFAQVSAVADALDVARPLAVPRWSGTIVEPHVQRLLERHALDAESLADPHAPERELARRLLPEPLAAAIGALRDSAARDLAAVRDAGAGLLPDAVPDGLGRRLERQIERLERRYRNAVRRANEDAFHDLATLRGALRPGGARQERALNLLPALARHGPLLLERMVERAGSHADDLVGAREAAGRPVEEPAQRAVSAP